MTILEQKLDAIKQLIFGAEPPAAPAAAPTPAPAAPVALSDFKTSDGVVLSVDKLEVGGSVTIGTDPAPDAEYKLESGEVITVAGGLITELESPAAAAAEPAAQETMKAEFEALKAEFAEQKDELKKLKEALEASKNPEPLKQMFSILEELAAEPKQAPAEPTKWEDMTPLQRFRAQKN